MFDLITFHVEPSTGEAYDVVAIAGYDAEMTSDAIKENDPRAIISF